MTRRTYARRGGGSKIDVDSLIATPLDPSQYRAAGRVIIRNSLDRDDARLLLEATGLAESAGHAKAWHRGGPSGTVRVIREGTL